jgi:hypothetical protein
MTLGFAPRSGRLPRYGIWNTVHTKNMGYGVAPTLGMIPDTVIPEGELCVSRPLFLIGPGKNSMPRY